MVSLGSSGSPPRESVFGAPWAETLVGGVDMDGTWSPLRGQPPSARATPCLPDPHPNKHPTFPPLPSPLHHVCRWRCDSVDGLVRPRWGLPLGGLAYHPCPSTEGAGWHAWSSAPANGAAAPPDTLCKEDREGASGGGLKGENQFGIPLVRIRPSPHTSPPHGPHPPGVHLLRLRGRRGIATFS